MGLWLKLIHLDLSVYVTQVGQPGDPVPEEGTGITAFILFIQSPPSGKQGHHFNRLLCASPQVSSLHLYSSLRKRMVTLLTVTTLNSNVAHGTEALSSSFIK